MRSLKQDPITQAEAVRILRELAAEEDAKKRYGDVRPLVLRAAANQFLRVGFAANVLVDGYD